MVRIALAIAFTLPLAIPLISCSPVYGDYASEQLVFQDGPSTVLSESLTLSGVTRTITKVADQGDSAITYKVDSPGWPDPTTGKDLVAYAKTGKRPTETFPNEIKWLKKIDQLLSEGKFNNRQWIVFHGVDNKMNLLSTSFGLSLYEKMNKGDVTGCKAAVKTKLPLIVAEAKAYVTKFGVLHTDIHPGNVLWDKDAKDPSLIDWGRAEEVASWTPAIEARVTKQAEESHLNGELRLCHDLRKS